MATLLIKDNSIDALSKAIEHCNTSLDSRHWSNDWKEGECRFRGTKLRALAKKLLIKKLLRSKRFEEAESLCKVTIEEYSVLLSSSTKWEVDNGSKFKLIDVEMINEMQKELEEVKEHLRHSISNLKKSLARVS